MFSTYIWSIKVFGNETIPEEEILSVFEELGVSSGSLKNKIDLTDKIFEKNFGWR